MWDLSNILPIGIIISSLLGSTHCVGMCGPLLMASVKNSYELFAYHLGRLFCYITLACLAAQLGKFLFQYSEKLSWLTSFLMASIFFKMAINIVSGKGLHWSWPKIFSPHNAFQNMFKRDFSWQRSFILGVLTGFLPCGWLYTFILGAAATQSLIKASIFLFCFWLGTLPLLSVSPWLLQKILRPILQSAPKFSAAILLMLAFTSLGIRLLPTKQHTNHCHHHASIETDNLHH